MIRHDLLIRLVKSVDYPVENFVILFQGTTNNFDFEKIKNENIKKFTIITSDYNVGCSRGWNYIINKFPSPYWLICGDDTYFESGTLKTIHTTVIDDSNKETIWYCFQEKSLNGELTAASSSNFSSFIFTQKMFDKVGIFDENIYPAYFEDFDMWQRLVNNGEPRKVITDAFIYTGDGTNQSSCSLHSVTDDYRDKMNQCHNKNKIYIEAKWNNGSFQTPFNLPTKLNEIDIHENYYENQKIITGHTNPAVYTQFEIINSTQIT